MTKDVSTAAVRALIATTTEAYTYRDLLDMLDFIEDYDFDASEADGAAWLAVIKQALAAGWTRNA